MLLIYLFRLLHADLTRCFIDR